MNARWYTGAGCIWALNPMDIPIAKGRNGLIMNQLKIHNITDITISREVFERGSRTDFTVINITATDMSGTKTEIACFVGSEYTIDPGDIDIATRYIAA